MKERTGSQVEQTQDRILKYIKENNIPYNAVLPKESDLSQELGVSHGVMREAISGLRSLGFLETKRKKGTIFVQPKVFGMLRYVIASGLLDDNAIIDLYELRLMLEIGMADLVIENRNDEMIAQLMAIVEKEESSADTEELRALDVQFHTILYNITGNRSLAYFQHLLHELFALYTPRPSNWQKTELMTHRTLVTLLQKGDTELFRTAMRVHLEPQIVNKEKNIARRKG